MIWDLGRVKIEVSERTLVMGILNATPDSFSDGGLFFHSVDQAIARGLEMMEQGADIIDVGGESTRPGAAEVSVADEISRVVPVIEALCGLASPIISVDTSKAEVARAALDAGAVIVNDVTGFRDPEMVALCTQRDCGLVVMHMQGDPRTMQLSPYYQDVVSEVRAFFEERLSDLTKAGIAAERICFDPGIGFGKTREHNLALLRECAALSVESRPLLMGLSRKSLIPAVTGRTEMESRDWPTLALSVLTALGGAQIHRVHDVAQTAQALRMHDALRV